MRNTLTFGSYTFNDDTIFSINIATEVDPICAALSADSLKAVVRSDKVGDKKLFTTLLEWYHTSSDEGYVVNDGDLEDYTYGDPVYYYRDGTLYGKFFITQVTRDGDDQFTIEATSAIGLMISQLFVGGVYTNVTAKSIIDAIMADTNVPYTIAAAVQTTVVAGFIPYGNKRDALQQLCFPPGINITKSANGTLQFLFNIPSTSKEIPDERIFLGGSNEYTAPATQIALTEHLYFNNPNAQAEEVYTHSGAPAVNAVITFDDPIVPTTITADSGVTIVSSGATFVQFSGSGSIYAKKYSHSTQELTWNADTVNGEEKTYSITDATMVTALNSANVLSRLVKYYTQAKTVKCDVVVDGERAGDYVSFNDPFSNGVSGFISKMDLDVSMLNKASLEVARDWFPTDTGNNFNAFKLFQTAKTYTAGTASNADYPTAAVGKAARLVLIGGFRGGQGGSAGEDGQAAVKGPIEGSGQNRGQVITGGAGGEEGGKGGKGGTGVMVYSVDIASLPSSFSVTAIGTGGAGGAAAAFQQQGDMGSLGGNTTVTINGTSYSSASGSENTSGFINFINGDFYNYPGADGYDNNTGTGGSGETAPFTGGSFTAEGQTWAGGARGTTKNGSGYNSAYGGGGGGAAYGTAGAQGGQGNTYNGSYTGSGAQGATPVTPSQATFPYCGQGGHGGGCGGGGGRGYNYYGAASITPGSGGAGGAGSPGGQGSNGAVILYYGT